MARIYQRKGKQGIFWYVDYVVDGRRVRKRVGTNKRLAELALADVRVKIERKELGLAPKDKDVESFLAEYLGYAKSNKAERTWQRDVQTLKHFTELVHASRLSTITPPKLEAYKARRREEGAKAATVNRELNTIKAMLNKAVAWGYLSHSPAKTVSKFKEPKRQVRYLSPKEVERLLEAANPRMGLVITTLLYTGLRRDELIHLTWSDLDFDRKALAVQAKDGWHPKDYEARHIPLSDRLLRILKAHRDSRGGGKEGYVFSGQGGKPLIGNLVSRDFRTLTKRCEIEGVSLHTLRHTFASFLVMSGVDLYTVQKLLGHSSIKTTEIYAHLAPDYLRSAIGKLDIKLPQNSAVHKLLT